MADPVVHITNGVPDAGTGVITTLGMLLIDGANATLGATTDLTTAAGAAGSINSHLRTISRDLAAGIVLQGGANTIGAVTQGTSPWVISGSVSVSGTVTVTGTVAATQSGTWNITNISGTISLPSGAATAAKQPALGTAGTPSADVLSIQGITSMVPLKMDGSAVTQPISGNVSITGNVNCVQVTSPWVTSVSGNVSVIQGGNLTTRVVGNGGNTVDFASTQNVSTPQSALLIGAEYNIIPTTISNGNSSPLQLDSAANLLVNIKTGTVAASQSGSWSVLPVVSAASNGLTNSRVQSAASTNATNLKASAGTIAAIDLFNLASYMVFLKLYNKASAPSVGTDVPVWTIPLPASGGFSVEFGQGEYFSVGIAYAITKLQDDTDATAVAAKDVTGRIKWI